MQKIYNALSSNDVKGPKLQHQICDAIEIEEILESLPAESQLKNYDLDDLALDDNDSFIGFETKFVEPSECSQNLE